MAWNYNDWESANEDRLYDRGACWAEELKKQREEAEKARLEQEAEKQRKIQEAEDYIKSHNLYQVKVANDLVQLSLVPQNTDDTKLSKAKISKAKKSDFDKYEADIQRDLDRSSEHDDDDPYMQR